MARLTGNFLSREPVQDVAGFIPRVREVSWVAENLRRATPQNCNLVGEPRIGKTSLLYYIYGQQAGLPPRTKGVYVWLRLLELAAYDSQSFWQFFWQRLQIEGEMSAGETEEALTAQQCFAKVETAVDTLLASPHLSRLIFCIDDFDLLTGLQPADLNWLRALAVRHAKRLAFVITSSRPLTEITNQIEGETAVSPFANIFHNLHVGLLTRNEAELLCQRAAAAEELPPLIDDDVAFLLHEAGRHPDLLKAACGHLFNARRWGSPTESLYEEVLSQFRYDGHVRWLCKQLLERRQPDEKRVLCAAARAAAQGEPAPGDRILLNRLRHQLGLLENRQEGLVPFADVFGYWACQRLEESAPKGAGETAVAPAPPAIFKHLPAQRRAILHQREISLTSLENRLLTYLLDHAGEVCRLEDLHRDLWDPGKSIAVVEKAINRLRGKIEEDPKHPRYILAARGEGYLMRDPNEVG